PGPSVPAGAHLRDLFARPWPCRHAPETRCRHHAATTIGWPEVPPHLAATRSVVARQCFLWCATVVLVVLVVVVGAVVEVVDEVDEVVEVVDVVDVVDVVVDVDVAVV